MATLTLIAVTDWKPPLISRKKLLAMPVFDVSVAVKDDDIMAYAAVSDFKKRLAEFKKNLDTEFDGRFFEFSKTRFAVIQDAIDDLETRLATKTKEEAEKLVQGANVLLKNACLTWQSELAKLGDEAVNAALAKFLKAAKQPITKAKAKCVAKIVVKGLLSVLAGAADVAKAIKAGDAKTALKDLFTKVIIPFGKVAYDEYKSTWPNVQNVCKQIEAHIKELAVALAALAAHDKKYKAGEEVSSLDVLFDEAALKANDLKTQMGLLDGLVIEYVDTITEQKKRLEELRKESPDEKVSAVVEACISKIERAGNLLKKITEHQQLIEAMQKQLAAHKPPATTEALASLIRAISEGRKGMEALSTVLTALKSVAPKK